MADTDIKLFGKWDHSELEVEDMSLRNCIPLTGTAKYVPHTAGRYQAKRFRKIQCPLVERLMNGLMFKGRNSGKKMMAMRIIEQAFDLIHLQTEQNPIQILIKAVENAGPREDSTRVGRGGAVRRQGVDVSPMRRVNQGLYLISIGARNAAFRNIKSIAECLCDEVVNASKGSSNSFAIKKKDEIERVAKLNR
eukprot:TRINITY_DN6851_c0_g1_i1.p1 TRINITY_DN6851_c0_g1~~TRINITY_DN6851_c0_g1_i1.p1  ORF type:complete len:193 (+),score=18.71 TRINITY_DN6851_c0_g1_i1:20-598(+)